MEWHEIYAGLTQDPGRPEGERARVFAWLELEERIRRWAEHDSRTTAPLPVDELVSDTCEAVWRNLPAARGGATFAGFVFGQYRNQRRLRRSREPRLSRRPVDAEPRLPGGESALDEHAPAGANLEPAGEPCVLLLQLRSCLEQLPTRPRAAVKLRFLDGAPYDEIAAELAITPNNARQLVSRGIRQLRQCLKAGEPSPTGPE